MKKVYFFKVLLFVSITLCSIESYGQILAWHFGSTSGAQSTAASHNATTVDGNLEMSSLTRGSGLIGGSNTLVRSFVAVTEGPFNTDQQGAIDNNMYFQFSIKAKPDYYVSLSTLNAKFRKSSDNATSGYIWRYSLDDGSTFNNIESGNTSTIGGSDGTVQSAISLSGITALKNVPSSKNIIFRLYVWGLANETNSFAIGRTPSGTTENSLSISGTVLNTLPVKFGVIKAESKLNSVNVKWQTSFEYNNSYFEVQRSLDGEYFQTIGKVYSNANALNDYVFEDVNPYIGIAYYQIKQIDINGDFSISKIIPHKFLLNEQTVSLTSFPEKQFVKVHCYSNKNIERKIEIYDMKGVLVVKRTVLLSVGNNILELPFSEQKGVYVFRANLDKSVVSKFVF